MFIQQAVQDPVFYVSVILTVMVSIVLHELAHGWMALRLGDDTPTRAGHMTVDPFTHLGPMSIAALLLCGIAWGRMPIDPSRLRGRYAQAKVALAGPLTNLVLAALGLTVLGLWSRFGVIEPVPFQRNLVQFLLIFGAFNIMLCLFNLAPVPPLDGSHILANLHRPYAQLIDDPNKQGLFIMGFIFLFFLIGAGWGYVFDWAYTIAQLIAGNAQFLYVLHG